MLNLFVKRQGPLAPPLDRDFWFSELALRFGAKPYYRAKFQLPRPSGSACEFFPMLNVWQVEGPLDPPLDGNFRFSDFFLRFGGKPYHHAKFLLPRSSGSARTFPWAHPQTDKQTNIHSLLYI